MEDDLRNFKIVIQYEGTRYQGWQRQGTTQNTLQGKFEALLSKIAGTPVEIQASGRTDAGVHALGQTANFHMNTELSCEELLDKLNQYLPEDVAVISCQEAAPRFHARLNAVGKTYCYRIHNSRIPAVFDRRLVWQIEQQLDVDAMKTAAKYLVRTHDFAAFTSAKNKKKSTVRSIESHFVRAKRRGYPDFFSGRRIFVPYGPHSDRNTGGESVSGCADRKKLLRFWTEKTGRRRECWHRRRTLPDGGLLSVEDLYEKIWNQLGHSLFAEDESSRKTKHILRTVFSFIFLCCSR